jgi:xylulokinase
MSYLGIDIGSSQVKAVAFDEKGRQLASAGCKYDYTMPRPGWMELDSDEVIRGAFRVIAECAGAVAETSPVRAIACSSQGEAFTLLDAAGKALNPAMISGDCRAAEVIGNFTERFGKERIYRITGHTPSAMFSIAKLLWVKEFMPEIWSRMRYCFCFEDLLAFRLTGQGAIGYSLAGRTMLFDINTHAWSEELLAELGMKKEQLAVPYPSGTAIGCISENIAAELGLTTDVQFVTGGHDQIIGALGCGATQPGTAMYAAGSVECAVPLMKEKVLSAELCEANLCTYDFALPGCYASVAYSLTGSNLLEYFTTEIVRDEKRDFAALIGDMPEKPSDLLVIPYFTPSGTPYFDARTPATVYGWRFSTSRGELLKGLLEGVAYEMRLNFEFLKKTGFAFERLIATGGGFRSREVVQLHADILNMSIAGCDEKEAGCRGAAMLAQRALGDTPVIPPPEILAVVEPREEFVRIYEEKFKKWEIFSRNIRSLSPCLS